MKEQYHYRLNMGFCPICKVNKLFGQEKRCPECRAIAITRTEKWRKNNPDKCKESDAKHNQQRIKRNEERKANGMCVDCGKRKSEQGFTRCSICRAKRAEKQRCRRTQNYTKPKTQIWRENGWCLKCGCETLKDGYKVCEECYQKLWNVSHNDKANAYRDKVRDREHNIYVAQQKARAN